MPQPFQTEAYFRACFRARGRSLAYRAQSPAEHAAWRDAFRVRLRELIGLHHFQQAPLNPRITETLQCAGYRRERVVIDVEPGVSMPLYVLIPDGPADRLGPPVIAAHGHGSGGKLAVVGIDDDPRMRAKIAEHNYAYGARAAQAGFVVFCPDARGFGERREWQSDGPEKILESSCFQLSHMALPLGMSVAGMWTWDLMRLLDYIEMRPESREKPMGCIGLSGGGLQTLYLSALDERVACAVISGYFYGVEDSLLHQSNNCACNYVPLLWENADMGDIAALIAPRPLMIEAARQDPLNGPRGMDNVLEQIAITRPAYITLGADECFDSFFFDGGHQWNGEKVHDWLRRWLAK